MSRKIPLLILLSALVFALAATSVAPGADKPSIPLKDQAFIPARFAPVYSFPGRTGSEYTAPPAPPEKMVLRDTRASDALVEQLGTTTYDYQHNCTMGRQVEHRRDYSDPYNQYGFYVHFDWMAQTGDILGQGRGIGYQAFDISTCDHVFWPGGLRAESGYAGYVAIDAHNIDHMNSWGILTAHQYANRYLAKAYWDYIGAGPVFGIFNSDGNQVDIYGWYQNNGTGPGNENIWPKIDWDIDGDDYILHMVTSESGGATGDPQTCSYYRRVGPYGVSWGVWSNQRLIDTVMNINVTVASSPVSDKVAIVWNAPVDYKRDFIYEFDGQYENDIWFAIVADNGASWVSTGPDPSIGQTVDQGLYESYDLNLGGNLTTYDPTDGYRAYCDISALWYIDGSENDWLQIVWGCREWIGGSSLARRRGAIFHWNQKTDAIRTVVKADWDIGGFCYGHTWGTDASKPTISQCDGKLYVCYSQFGDRDHPCDWYDIDNGIVSGYLYMTVFDPVYDAWDKPQRVTAIPENPAPCIPGDIWGPGDCNSEYWASMARYSRYDTCKADPHGEVLDILYINDYAPGPCIQPQSGVWTFNPVNWVVYPCRAAVPEPDFTHNAGPGYGLCVGQPIFVIGTTDDTTLTLTIENPGILDNDYSVVTIIDSSTGPNNGANTTIGVIPSSGTIPAKGGWQDLEVTISTSGEDDSCTVYGRIVITHEAEGSPASIPLCIEVIDGWNPIGSTVLATSCKRLRVYNNGRMSNDGANMSLDYVTLYDPDGCASLYLYDASPIICRDVDYTTICYFSISDHVNPDQNALLQVSPMYYDNVSNDDYEYATAEFVTSDLAVGLIAEYFAPKAMEDCEFIIQKLKFWNRTGETLSGVAAGEILDWDVPSFESASNNESDYDATRSLIYQQCNCPGHRDPCDSLLSCNRYAGIASFGPEGDFKNYLTLENDVYIYTSGPYGSAAPLPADPIYGLMTGSDGFNPAVIPACEDLFTLVTFDVYDLFPGDTQCVVKILVTSRDDPGAADLKAAVDAANAFIDSRDEIRCIAKEICDCRPGDANGDGQVNVGDAVYIIAYVFKGGPMPIPYATCSGDANGDCQCNVGDAVYLISYVFKGGPPPPSCIEWTAYCGPLE